MPSRLAWLMEAIGDLLGFFVCLVLVRYGAAMAFDSARLGAITIKNLVFPEWWLLAPLPVDIRAAGDRVRVPLYRLLTWRARPAHRSDLGELSDGGEGDC